MNTIIADAQTVGEYKPMTLTPITQQWILFILLDLKGLDEIVYQLFDHETYADILRYFHVPEAWIADTRLHKTQIYRHLYQQQTKLVFDDEAIPPDWAILYNNYHLVCRALRLDDIQQKILRLVMHMQEEAALVKAMNLIPCSKKALAIRHLSKLLDITPTALNQALRNGILFTSDLLAIEDAHYNSVDDLIYWGGLLCFSTFAYEHIDDNMLLQIALKPTPKPTLSADDYYYIADMHNMLRTYLSTALNHKRCGVNVLIYGEPGTGKTAFATLLGHELDFPAYSLVCERADHFTLDASARFTSVRLAQTLMQDKAALIIFDEIEDVFSGSDFDISYGQAHKGAVNQLLENNPVPMIWISNSVDCLDPAYLRRFDLILEMPIAPKAHREKLIHQSIGDKLSAADIKQLATHNSLTPAIITRAAAVVSAINSEQATDDTKRILNQQLRAQNKPLLQTTTNPALPHNIQWIACDQDLVAIEQGIKNQREARICCYGPPGTGKTAWAKALADSLELPLLSYKASDLMGKYVGETEKNIANAFHHANQDDVLLVIDEADTFLFDRTSAHQNWESSMVNEMLTQIEAYNGRLIISTNLMDNLDHAVLRRFDLKLYFDYLRPEQSISLAQAQLQALDLAPLTTEDSARLRTLVHLTPGDFALLARRHRFAPFDNSSEFVHALIAECQLKPVAKKRIGF